jgi:hypothetical protein
MYVCMWTHVYTKQDVSDLGHVMLQGYLGYHHHHYYSFICSVH